MTKSKCEKRHEYYFKKIETLCTEIRRLKRKNKRLANWLLKLETMTISGKRSVADKIAQGFKILNDADC